MPLNICLHPSFYIRGEITSSFSVMASLIQTVALKLISPPSLLSLQAAVTFKDPLSISLIKRPPTSKSFHLYFSHNNTDSEVVSTEEEENNLVESLSVPDSWLEPSIALQESEWLRVALEKWLDDEYCPEPSNIEISKVAARSYYESLVAKKRDLGEILLNMVRDLKYVSFQESFHGVFSSANAAIHLITTKIDSVPQ